MIWDFILARFPRYIITFERDIFPFLRANLGNKHFSLLDSLPILVNLFLAEDDQSHPRFLNKSFDFINDSARQPFICSSSFTATATTALYCAVRYHDVPFHEIEWCLLVDMAS